MTIVITVQRAANSAAMDQLTQFHIRHENHLQKSLAFLLGLYFNQNWT